MPYKIGEIHRLFFGEIESRWIQLLWSWKFFIRVPQRSRVWRGNAGLYYGHPSGAKMDSGGYPLC